MTYEFKSDYWSGPLPQLLLLIEEKKLEVTAVSLAQVTADFLKHLNILREKDEVHPELLTDFIWVASKLILIKSRAILPNLEVTPEEEAEIKDLEERLRIYREFGQAKASLKNLFSTTEKSYVRKYLPPPIFYPPEGIKAENLLQALQKITETLELAKKMPSDKIQVFDFEEKLQALSSRIQKELKASFETLSKDKSKAETIVIFLAVLHLLKENLIAFKQNKQFSDIIIMKAENNGN